MKFEPQCKTKADLHREWARVLDMSEGTGVRVEEGLKYAGTLMECSPAFCCNPSDYEFSIGIVEGKHVFRGDVLSFRGKEIIADTDKFNFSNKFTEEFFSWNPPKQEPEIPEGFTKWGGGGWTGHPEDEVEVAFGGGESGKARAGTLYWKRESNSNGGYAEIIAFKVTKKYQPKTVMVELLIEDAEALTSTLVVGRIGEACRKALGMEKLL